MFCPDFHEYQEFAVFGDYVNFPFFAAEVSFNDCIPLTVKKSAASFSPSIPVVFRFIAAPSYL